MCVHYYSFVIFTNVIHIVVFYRAMLRSRRVRVCHNMSCVCTSVSISVLPSECETLPTTICCGVDVRHFLSVQQDAAMPESRPVSN